MVKETRGSAVRPAATRLAYARPRSRDSKIRRGAVGSEEKIGENRVEKRRYLLHICRRTDRSCLTALTGKSYDDSLPPRDN